MSHALVLGGKSLIGRPLVEALLQGGPTVTILHRSPGTPFGDRVDEVSADRNDGDAVRDAVNDLDIDLVFDNVYAFERGTPADAVIATVRALTGELDHYVFTSSVAAYPEGGPHGENAELREAADPCRCEAVRAAPSLP